MSKTFEEIKERLKNLNEVELMELLHISSNDLVERFDDYIEDNQDELESEFEEFYDEDTETH